MKISFIITSLNRFELLKKAIESIEETSRPQGVEIEIIAVLQESDPGKISIPESSCKYLYIHRIEPVGASAARNFGIKRSAGDYLVFIDDDAYVGKDFIGVLNEEITKSQVGAYCGKIVDPDTNIPYVKWFSTGYKKRLSFFGYRYFMASALVLKRQVIDEVGYLDEEFGGGAKYLGAEESDYFFRLLQKRKTIIYLPRLIFYHPLASDIPAGKVFNYSHAISVMLAKQIYNDPWHFYIYMLLIIDIFCRSGARVLQSIFMSSESLRKKERQYHYLVVLKGTIQGLINYVRR